MSTTCGKQHVGKCTTSPVYTYQQAADVLTEAGYQWNQVAGEWFHPSGVRGRLCWAPDYCHQEQTRVGTRFWLQRPHGHGTIKVLG